MHDLDGPSLFSQTEVRPEPKRECLPNKLLLRILWSRRRCLSCHGFSPAPPETESTAFCVSARTASSVSIVRLQHPWQTMRGLSCSPRFIRLTFVHPHTEQTAEPFAAPYSGGRACVDFLGIRSFPPTGNGEHVVGATAFGLPLRTHAGSFDFFYSTSAP